MLVCVHCMVMLVCTLYGDVGDGDVCVQRRNASVKRSLIKTPRGPMFYM